MTVLQTSGLTKRFGEVVAVRDLDLSVDDGEVFGFLGPNGAGKSTTINILLGFLDPSEGQATVLGNDATTQSRAVRRRVGLLPEGYDVYENLTGREHVVSAVETKGADDDPDEIIDRVGLDPDDARRPAGDYSTGMTQRLMLGVALTGSPDLLILDEPSSGLDPEGIKRLRRIVREEAERGATVFFSSHILGQVEAVCDRVGIIRDGELVAVDSIEGLRENVGGGSTLVVQVDQVPDDVAHKLKSFDGIDSVSVDGTTLRIGCDDDAKTMVIEELEDLGSTVEDFSTEEAPLEDLFAAYTEGEG